MIKRGTDTFSYDSQNRLTSATVNGTTAQYQYNSAGQRVAKTVLGQTTYYLYGQDGQLLEEADANTHQITRQYIWLGQKPVAYLFGDKGYYVHTDNTDTPQVLTDSQQKVVWTTQSYPFGKQQYSGSIPFNLRYPGQYFDEETGLHYNGHRYYDPNTGRYITSDPIGLAGGINTYAYVGNDPLGRIDPQGLNADDLSETPGQRSLEQLHSQEHDVISPLVDTDLNNDGIQDVISPVVMNAGAGKAGGSTCQAIALPNQVHHYATNKSKIFTPRIQKIADRYGLNLDAEWNKDLLPHQGRHPNLYHEFVERGMEQAARESGTDAEKFKSLFDYP